MRRFLAFLAGGIILSALVVNCTDHLDSQEIDITTVRCSISRIDVEEDFATGIVDTLTTTKASFNGANFIWSLGDRIGIIPNTGSQIYFAVNEGAGTSTAAFDGGDWAMKSTGTFYAYYPLYPDIFLSKDHVSVSYSGQTQSGNNNNLHTGNYWTLYTAGTTAVGNALNFSFNHLTSFFKTYVTVPAGTYTKITFSAPSEVFIKDGYFDLGAQTPTIVGTTMTDILSLDLQNVTFTDETELTGYLVLAPVDITGIPITVTVYKEGTATYEYTLTKTSPMIPAKTYAFRAEEYTPATGVSLSQTSINKYVGATETLTATVTPADAYPNVIWMSSNETVATVSSTGVVTAVAAGTATITARAIWGGCTATCTVTVLSIPTAVDLGLPSGIKWASFNMGAQAPEEYGDYYAWGETEPYYSSQSPLTWKDGKTGYNWASYKWCNGSSTTLTKYNTKDSYGTVDSKTVLDPEDDVAYVKLGGKWRMPTDAEWTELREKCNWTWTTQNGVKGYLVTSKTNGNSIFLPAAGYRDATDLSGTEIYGYYWTSSLRTQVPYIAYDGLFYSTYIRTSESNRYLGHSVRPVSK